MIKNLMLLKFLNDATEVMLYEWHRYLQLQKHHQEVTNSLLTHAQTG